MPDRSARRRDEVLALLRDAGGPLEVAQIAERLGVHPNTVRFHLDALVGTGRVERTSAAPAAPGRPPLLFRAVRRMDPAGPRDYRVLAEVLAADLATAPDPGPRGRAAGRTWGRLAAEGTADAPAPDGPPGADEAVERLVGLLGELGFAPDPVPAADPVRIGLRHCPFLELAVDRPGVVCPVHLGIMQGAMEAWGAPLTVERLDAFVEPDLCVVRLAGAGTP
ncbi:MAG: helix-turn-helix transcriptional regulator [Pseudonocardia sp.]